MHVRPEARRKGGRCMRWAGRIAGTLLLAGVIVILDAGIASAHAQLETTQPVEGAVLSSSPARVVMHFDQAVEIDLGSVRVIGPGDRRVDEGGTYHPNGQASSIAVNLPPRLSNGTYIVAWRVISADSHPVHGAFIFSLGTDAGAAKANALA
ncbi:MAG: copper resistance CopC family protein, partial [Acidimicrobiales bacterium]